MIILLKLILAHFIGDFALQPAFWVKAKMEKKVKSYQFYLHVVLQGILIMVFLWDWSYWALALILTLLHGLIDIAKIYMQEPKNKPIYFLMDQFLHVATIIAVWYFGVKPDLDIYKGLQSSEFWVYVTALVFITKVSSIVIQEIMQNWTKELNKSENIPSLKNAGKYI